MHYQLHLGDCLEIMQALPAGSVDLIACDLPYGTTRNAWDAVLPFDKLWPLYQRVLRAGGAAVLTATQPFSSAIVMSNPGQFKYEWVWQKSRVTGVLNAKHQPLRQHEVVLVFADGKTTYNPQGLQACSKRTSTGVTRKGSTANYGAITQTEDGTYEQTATGYPRSVLAIPSGGKTVHPTQKPVALMEYLIRTYTHPGDVVLDNTMGSGTTGVACMNTGRAFIGIEKDEGYFAIAQQRIEAADMAAIA